MRRAFLGFVLSIFLASLPANAAGAELRGLLKDQQGNPIANLAFSLIRAGVKYSQKSDQLGNFVLKNLASGDYLLQVESPRFRVAAGTTVKISSGQKTLLTVVLQQVFSIDEMSPVPKNDDIRTILRNTADGRLIFRNNPDVSPERVETATLFRSNGIVEVYSGSAWDNGDFSVIPGSPYGGLLTNFAYVEDPRGPASYVFAGQFISGEDSLWKVRNSVRYELGTNQSVEMLLGYTRLAFNSSNLMFLNDPTRVSRNSDFINAASSARTLALGLTHSWTPVEEIRVSYGIEVDRFSAGNTQTFSSPALDVSWRPWSSGQLAARVTSRRATRYNTLRLPDGDYFDVAEPVFWTKTGDRLHVGVNRHYEVTGSQRLGPVQAELSVFADQLQGGSPYAVIYSGQKDARLYDLPEESLQRGIRAGLSAGSGHLNYQIDYAYATALGVDQTDSLARSVAQALRMHRYHAVTGRVQATVPRVHTSITGVIRMAPGRPLTTIDLFSDTLNISNQSVNCFVRQVIPFPDVLGFSPRLEALLDLRNLLNQDIGVVSTEIGDVVVVRNPRTVRGGISLNF